MDLYTIFESLCKFYDYLISSTNCALRVFCFAPADSKRVFVEVETGFLFLDGY
jgi:hypothetical protein